MRVAGPSRTGMLPKALCLREALGGGVARAQVLSAGTPDRRRADPQERNAGREDPGTAGLQAGTAARRAARGEAPFRRGALATWLPAKMVTILFSLSNRFVT